MQLPGPGVGVFLRSGSPAPDELAGVGRSFLSWKQVRRFEKRGAEIGSHTVSHASLTSLSGRGRPGRADRVA